MRKKVIKIYQIHLKSQVNHDASRYLHIGKTLKSCELEVADQNYPKSTATTHLTGHKRSNNTETSHLKMRFFGICQAAPICPAVFFCRVVIEVMFTLLYRWIFSTVLHSLSLLPSRTNL